MRKIINNAVNAFIAKKAFKEANTEVRVVAHNSILLLHGHPIAERIGEKRLYIDMCGWNTSTIRESLNGLPGVKISTRKGVIYLNGKEWDGKRKLVSSDYYELIQ